MNIPDQTWFAIALALYAAGFVHALFFYNAVCKVDAVHCLSSPSGLFFTTPFSFNAHRDSSLPHHQRF